MRSPLQLPALLTGCCAAAHLVVPLDGTLALRGVQPGHLLLAVVQGGLGAEETRLEWLLHHLISCTHGRGGRGGRGERGEGEKEGYSSVWEWVPLTAEEALSRLASLWPTEPTRWE